MSFILGIAVLGLLGYLTGFIRYEKVGKKHRLWLLDSFIDWWTEDDR